MANILALRILQNYSKCAKPCVVFSPKFSSFRKVAVQSLASVPVSGAEKCQSNHKNLVSQKRDVCFTSIKSAPETQQASHDHVKHWTAEKLLTVTMLGTIPAAVLCPSPIIESFLALALTVHSHWGVEALVVDYIRPSVFGKLIPKISIAAVYLLSTLTLGGLFYFIYTDVGLVNAVKLLWKL